MTSGYAHGYAGLAEYLGVQSRKTAKRIHERVQFPVAKIPGVTRETLMFRLADIDATLARYKVTPPSATGSADLDAAASAIADAVMQAVGGPARKGAR